MDPNFQQPVQNVPPPIPPVEQKSSKAWLKWVLIIIVAVILSSIATYLFLNQKSQKQTAPQVTQTLPTPTPNPSDETANWKTYTSKIGKISIEYPNNWYQQISTGEGNQTGGNQYEEFSNYPTYVASDYGSKDDYLTFNISIGYTNDNKGKVRMMSDYISNLDKELKNSGRTYKEEQVTTKNGVNLIVYQEIGINVSSYTIRAAAIKNEFDYRFTLTARSNNALEKFRPTFDQILSTFKFTE